MPDTSPRNIKLNVDLNQTDLGYGAGFYVNATQTPWNKHFNMYDYVVDELPQLCKQYLPIDPNRSSIMGHSMGGHGAITIGLNNSHQYHSVSAFSPICAPTHCPWGQKAFQFNILLEKIRKTGNNTIAAS